MFNLLYFILSFISHAFHFFVFVKLLLLFIYGKQFSFSQIFARRFLKKSKEKYVWLWGTNSQPLLKSEKWGTGRAKAWRVRRALNRVACISLKLIIFFSFFSSCIMVDFEFLGIFNGYCGDPDWPLDDLSNHE